MKAQLGKAPRLSHESLDPARVRQTMYVSDTFCSELHYRADWRFCPISLNPSSEIKVSHKAHSMGGTEAALSGPRADGDQDVRSYRTSYVDLI
jgi:hypothetical protein